MRPWWSKRRWWLFAGLVFAGQVALIFLLSDFSTPAVRRAKTSLALHLVSGSANELIALNDPTLFALPHPESFSGRAWLMNTPAPARPFEWKTDLEWLPLPISQLGQGLAKFLQTNHVESMTTMPSLEPKLIEPDLPTAPVFPQKSSIRIEGALRNRKLLNSIDPPSFAHTDSLTNTVVQVLVDDKGTVLSETLLNRGSGSPQADQAALALARGARFQSLVSSGPRRDTNALPAAGLTWGTIIFSWHTLPATNSAGSTP